MAFSDYKKEYDNAPDPNEIPPEGIYSFKVKSATAGKDRQNRDRFQLVLKITGPGMIGATKFLTRYPDQNGGIEGIKSDLGVLGGGDKAKTLHISDLDTPKKLDRLVDLQVEGSIKHGVNKNDPEKPYVNITLRRLITAPMPPDPLRFPGANGANSNGDHAAESADVDASGGESVDVDASAEGVPF